MVSPIGFEKDCDFLREKIPTPKEAEELLQQQKTMQTYNRILQGVKQVGVPLVTAAATGLGKSVTVGAYAVTSVLVEVAGWYLCSSKA